MSRPDAEQLADALWRSYRSTVVHLIGTVVAAQEDADPDAELDPKDEARVAAWAQRDQQRKRQRLQAPAPRPAAAARRRSSP